MSSESRRRESRRPRARCALTWTLLGLLAGACSSPARLSVDDAQLANALDRRANVADVARALELADLGPLAIEPPAAPSELRPDLAEFWHASAYAWNPDMRRMRRRVRELRAAERSAGAPGPIQSQAMARDGAELDAEYEAQAMVDLFGLLGVGPSAAARELSRPQVRAALGEYEAAAWSLRFEVDRARVELAAAKSLETAMDGLYADASRQETRIAILARRGWIGAGMTEGALAALHMLEHRTSMARVEATRARAALAELCGLDAAHPAFDELQNGAIDRFHPEDVELVAPQPRELLSQLPRLRAAKLELAMAEAELQREARERWPMLGVGGRVMHMGGETFLGPMLGLNVPFPGSLDGRIEAARERRDAAYEALEDELAAARIRLERARRLYVETLELRDVHAPEADLSVARMLVSATAAFQVEPERLDNWSRALLERMNSLTALVRARADLVLAWIDWQEACGPRREELAP